jgi:hypothetical protein
MNDDDLDTAENERNKRLKSLTKVNALVMAVAALGTIAARHGWLGFRRGWQDAFWLVYGCSIACNLILTQKRTDLKGAPSPLSALDLSRRMEGPVKPIRSDHWSGEGSSEAR